MLALASDRSLSSFVHSLKGMRLKLKVAVLLGGGSTERDVSIVSGTQVVLALRARGHEVIAIDTAHGILTASEESQYFASKVGSVPPAIQKSMTRGVKQFDFLHDAALTDVDVYFIALHGGSGEDGTIQAVLKSAGLCYTGSDHLGSALAMNKNVAKTVLAYAGVPTPPWLMVPASRDDIAVGLGYPLVVKPCSQGSTVGLSVVRKEADLDAAIEKARAYDSEVMLEQFIPGRELTVAVLADEALAVGEIVLPANQIFDYEAKYQGLTSEVFPADIDACTERDARAWAVDAHKALRLSGYSRADFRLDESNNLWCLEVNTLPGLTKTSLLPQSAAAVGIDFEKLCEKICKLAIARHSVT